MEDMIIADITTAKTQANNKAHQKSGEDFSKIIKGAIKNVNRLEAEANDSIAALLQGKVDIHETMIALQKVDMSMRYLLAIRNKAMQAYREIMHMQF